MPPCRVTKADLPGVDLLEQLERQAAVLHQDVRGGSGKRLISTSSNAWTGCRLIVVALPVGVALLVAETLLIAIASRGGAAGDGRTAEGGACGGRRLLQPVEEAHRDAGTRRGGMSVAHGCREAKRVTGREEEKDGHGDLHCRSRAASRTRETCVLRFVPQVPHVRL